MRKQLSLLFLIVLIMASCTKKTAEEDLPQASSNTQTFLVHNLAADTGNTGHHTFYDLVNNTVVPLSDSATTNWHIAFLKTGILLNGGTSGPGNTMAIVQSGIFDEMMEVPTTGYKKDEAGSRAIDSGSGNGWYNYNDETHIISPIPGKVICIKTTEGYFVKLEVLSYYYDAPAQPELTTPSAFYTLRYSIQTDKTNQF